MKKTLIIAMAVLLTLSLLLMTACGGGGGGASGGGSDSGSASGDSGGGGGDSGPASDDSGGSAESGGLPPDTRVIPVGETQEAEGVSVTLDEVWVSTYCFDPSYLPEGDVFLFPHFTITNMNESEYTIENNNKMEFSTGNGCIGYIGGEEYRRTIKALMAYEGETKQMDVSIDYGATVKVMDAFIVPEDWESIEFAVDHNLPYQLVPKLVLKFEVENK